MKSHELIDIGVNLEHASFRGDRDLVVARAVEAGVSAIVVTGTNERASAAALEIARRRPGTLYCTAGVHPHNAKGCTAETIGVLRRLASHPEVVAIGECGLDFNRDFSPRPIQEAWFERQIELAAELRKPLFLHERDAHARFLEILRTHRQTIPGAVVHCFTGTGEELDAYLDLDLHVGITGWICDERRGHHLRELVRRVPADRLMLETDAPFLTPRDMRPRPANGRNEPAFLPHVARAVARARGESEADVARATSATARAFFGFASDA